jgi:hypothetical protein
MLQQVHTYADLRKQIHDDLRIQHPEWVQPNGESPMCDSYEARLIELLKGLSASEPQQLFSRPRGELEQRQI